MLFHGPIVSTMILIPPNALSIWRCTLSTSDVRNSCIFWSSETNPWSSPIEFEVKRATEELNSVGADLELAREFRLLFGQSQIQRRRFFVGCGRRWGIHQLLPWCRFFALPIPNPYS